MDKMDKYCTGRIVEFQRSLSIMRVKSNELSTRVNIEKEKRKEEMDNQFKELKNRMQWFIKTCKPTGNFRDNIVKSVDTIQSDINNDSLSQIDNQINIIEYSLDDLIDQID